MLNSVRLRLTVWYVGILSLVLIGFSIGVYTLLSRSAYDSADTELAGAIDVLQRSLRHEIDEHEGKTPGEESFVGVVATVYRDSFPGVAVGVYEGRRLITAKPGPGGVIPNSPSGATPKLFYSTGPRNNETWRTAVSTVAVKNAGEYQFVSTESLRPIEADLADLRRVFLFAVPLALGAAAWGGFFIARRSFAPVVAMSETVDRISSIDLHQRIRVANPKDELGKLASTFNSLLERLEQSFARQKQFMEDSSHELRTPLYVARTAAQVTLEAQHRDEPEYRESLATIDQQLHRMARLVEDMFLLARADAGVYPVEYADFYLEETVGECVRSATLLGRRKHVDVQASFGGEMPCRGDEGLLRQMVMILLDNAVKFTPEGGRVQVRVDTANPAAYSVIVQDTGPGIPDEAAAQLFDRFFRVEKSRSRVAGNGNAGAGLGLAIARWIAERHGGSLELAETGAQGSIFRATFLRVPIDQTDVRAIDRSQDPSA